MSDPSLLGLPTTFEFEGRFYHFTNPRTFEIEAAFVQWLQADAYRALLPHEKLLGPAKFSEQVAGWRRDCGPGGSLRWNKPACVEALYSDEGIEEMAWQQFAHAQGKLIEKGQVPRDLMDRETLERIMKHPGKSEELVRLVLGLKQDEGAEGNAGPPSPTPSAE